LRAPIHHYTEEQIAFVRENIKGKSRIEITNMFNERFNTNIKFTQMGGFLKRKGFSNGLDRRFKKGQKAWNEGMKGVNFGGFETQFKKGHMPPNYRPVGSERVNVDGYTEVKVADPNQWKFKHHIIWEEIHGPIPKGECLIFLDGNNRNVTLDNLQKVTRKQLVRLNQSKLISDNAEVTKTGVIIADILCKIGELKRTK
jgi:hypothetical protein